MPRPRWKSDDEFDEEDDEDFSDEITDDEYPHNSPHDDDAETVTCASCGTEVYEFSERCPACGDFLTHDTNPWRGRSWAWIALGLAGILAVVFVLLWEHGVITLRP